MRWPLASMLVGLVFKIKLAACQHTGRIMVQAGYLPAFWLVCGLVWLLASLLDGLWFDLADCRRVGWNGV